MRLDNSRKGPFSLGDGTGGTSTSFTLELSKTAGPLGIKLLFGDITGLTGTLSASIDGTNFFPLASWTDAGTYYAKSATVAAVDGMSLYFMIGGYNYVKFTRTAGSGPCYVVELGNAEEAIASHLAILSAGSGFVVASNKTEDAGSASGDVGDFIMGIRNDTLQTLTSNDQDYGGISVDKRGRVMVGGVPRELKGVQNTTITSSTSETTIVTAVTSTFLDLYGLVIANTSASACNVTIKDATSGTTRFIFAVPAGESRGFMLDVDAAVAQASSNNNWTATCSASVASIVITALYVKNI